MLGGELYRAENRTHGRMKIDNLGVDETFSLISDSRRRFTLYFLLSNGQANIETVSLQIAAWEQDKTIASVSEKTQETIKISLHHNHLPKLVESGIIEYDSRSGDIVRGDRFNEIQSAIEQIRANEEETGIDDSHDSSTDDEEPEFFLSP